MKEMINVCSSGEYFKMITVTAEKALSSVSDRYSCESVLTAVDEIVSNIEKYACLNSTDMISFSIDVDLDSFLVSIRFEYGGVLFDPVLYYKNSSSYDSFSDPGGRGIILTSGLMDVFSYSTEKEKNIIEMVKYLKK